MYVRLFTSKRYFRYFDRYVYCVSILYFVNPVCTARARIPGIECLNNAAFGMKARGEDLLCRETRSFLSYTREFYVRDAITIVTVFSDPLTCIERGNTAVTVYARPVPEVPIQHVIHGKIKFIERSWRV